MNIELVLGEIFDVVESIWIMRYWSWFFVPNYAMVRSPVGSSVDNVPERFNEFGGIMKKSIWFPKGDQIDPVLLEFSKGWTASEKWRGKDVIIPDVYPLHYFEYEPDEIADRERQLVLLVGWADYDTEMTITLGLFEDKPGVIAEISRHGGTEMTLKRDGKVVAHFPKDGIIAKLFGYSFGYKVVKL